MALLILVLILILILILGISIILVILFEKFRAYSKIVHERFSKLEIKKFLSSVIAPCKDTDFEFTKALKALTSNDIL